MHQPQAGTIDFSGVLECGNIEIFDTLLTSRLGSETDFSSETDFRKGERAAVTWGLPCFFFCWKLRILTLQNPFGFFFFQLFGPEDVLWTRSSIYNAAMHSPCTVADDFDHQLATGQTL